MISEGSCDTEDWSNDAENSAFLYRNKLHFKETSLKNIKNLTDAKLLNSSVYNLNFSNLILVLQLKFKLDIFN